MTHLEYEEEFVGRENHEVPKMDPGENCNAKKSTTINYSEWSESIETIDDENLDAIRQKNDVESKKGNQENRTYFTGYCGAKAGSGTDHLGEGRCKWHGGKDLDKRGGVKHNQHAATHSMSADPHSYAESLDPDEKEFVEGVTATILDRIRRRHGKDPDFLDRVMARRVAIKLHMVAKASDYIENVSGLVQVITTEHSSHEDKAPLLEEVRRFDNSIMQNLRDLGVLDDPTSESADALNQWREFIQGGENDEPVIEIEENADGSDSMTDGQDSG